MSAIKAWGMGRGAPAGLASRSDAGGWSETVLALLLMACGAFGQSVNDPGEGLRAELTATAGETSIKWWGKEGRTYFVQTSEKLLPGSWQFVPTVEGGADAVCSYLLRTNVERMFVRLVYTDQAHSGSAEDADFDGDGLSNRLEVSTSVGLNPLDALQDEDKDGLPDAWELQQGFSRFDGSNGGTRGFLPPMPAAPPPPVPPNPQSFYAPDPWGVLVWTEASEIAYNTGLAAYGEAVDAYPGLLLLYQVELAGWQAWILRVDPDGDGLSNLDEYLKGTKPRVADTDGDGFDDGVELAHGSLPLLASSTPPFLLEVTTGSVLEVMTGSSAPVVLLASRAGAPLAGKQVVVTSGNPALLMVPQGGGTAAPSLTLTTNLQGQVSLSLQAPGLPALGLVQINAALTEHAGVATDFQAAVVEPGLSFLRPDVWEWLARQGMRGGGGGAMRMFVPGAEAVVLSRASAVGGGNYLPGTPDTTEPGPPEPDGPPVERRNQPDLDEYEDTPGTTEFFLEEKLVVGEDEFGVPVTVSRYSWKKQRMKPGAPVVFPGTRESAGEYAATNDKYFGGKVVIESEAQVMAKAPNPTFSGSILNYLQFAELTAQGQEIKGSTGEQLTAQASNGSYDAASWRQIWLLTGTRATQDITRTFLVKTTTGEGDDAVETYGTFTLTVKKGEKVSTEGEVQGSIPGVSIDGGVVSVQPDVPASGSVRVDVLPIEVMQKNIDASGIVGGFASVSEIRPTRWHDAFQGANSNFAGLYNDRDRVRLRIFGLDDQDFSVKLSVTGITGTSTSESTDGPDEISAVNIIQDVSFVTDAVDDDGYNGLGEEDANLDGTHLSSFGAKAKFEIHGIGSSAIPIEVPITQPAGKARYVVRVLSESGALSPAELMDVMKDCMIAKEVYAQIGVDLELVGVSGMPLPPAIVPLLADGDLSEDGHNTSDYYKLLTDLPTTAGTNVIPVYLVRATIDSDRAVGVTVEYDAPRTGGIVVISMPQRTRLSLAHEICHALGRSGHNSFTEKHLLMKLQGTIHNSSHLDSKRFTYDEENTIKGLRKFYEPLR